MLESTKCKEIFTTGSSPDYAVTLRFFRPEDLKVYLDDELLTLGREYNILPADTYLKGGTIRLIAGNIKVPSFDYVSGKRLTVKRELTLVQQLTLPEHGKLPSESLEVQLDKLTMISQQLHETLNRCLLVAAVYDEADGGTVSAALQKLALHAEGYMNICQKAYDIVAENLSAIQSAPGAAQSTITATAEMKKLLAEIDALNFLEDVVAVKDSVRAAESAAAQAASAADRAMAASCNGVDLILGDRLADENANAILRYGDRLETD